MKEDQSQTINPGPNQDTPLQEGNPGIINAIISKIKNFFSSKDKKSTAYPKDLTPADVIALFDLQPEDIPALIIEDFPGIPPHIKVLNEIHLDHATPEDYHASTIGVDEGNEPEE